MDSSSWSAERKAQAGRAFANRVGALAKDPAYRARRRRNLVAADLAVAIASSQLSRTKVAEKAGMKLAQLSKQLDGETNLTLDSIGRICEAIGWDFDVALRRAGEARFKQPWERSAAAHINRGFLLDLVRKQEGAQAAAGNVGHARLELRADVYAANDHPPYAALFESDVAVAA